MNVTTDWGSIIIGGAWMSVTLLGVNGSDL